MKKYNIIFLFILLLFLGLSKNINVSTNDNTSTTSNAVSNVTTNSINNKMQIDPNLTLTLSDSVDSYGGYQIISYMYTGNSDTLYIPSSYNGKKITSIGDAVFL